MCSYNHSLTSALDVNGGSCQSHGPAALPPIKKFLTHSTGDCWILGPMWASAENIAPSGFGPRTLQHVVNPYTDCVRDIFLISPLVFWERNIILLYWDYSSNSDEWWRWRWLRRPQLCLVLYFTLTTLAWLNQPKMLVSVGICYAVTGTYSLRNGGNLAKYAGAGSVSTRSKYRGYQSMGILCVTSVFLLTPWSRVLLQKLTGS